MRDYFGWTPTPKNYIWSDRTSVEEILFQDNWFIYFQMTSIHYIQYNSQWIFWLSSYRDIDDHNNWPEIYPKFTRNMTKDFPIHETFNSTVNSEPDSDDSETTPKPESKFWKWFAMFALIGFVIIVVTIIGLFLCYRIRRQHHKTETTTAPEFPSQSETEWNFYLKIILNLILILH